jgi:hypothetical protein
MNCNDQNFSYPRFEPNQVLSSARLNDIVGSLDEQGRLTRNKLIGTGIACGLQFSVLGASPIQIYKGMGISSDGYLLNFCEGDGNVKDFGYWRAYNDPDQSDSPWIYDAGAGNLQQIPLYRLTNTSTDNLLGTLPGTGVFPLGNYVLILYLQRVNTLSDTCSDTCSRNGAAVEYTVVPLIALRSDLETKLGIGAQSVYEDAHIQKIKSKRFVAFQSLTDVDSVTDITTAYQNILQDTVAAQSLLVRLADTIAEAQSVYERLIAFSVAERQAMTDALADLRTFTTTPKYAQYAYDFVNDVIAAYDEFAEMAYYLAPGCCIDCEAHERYVMLGQLNHGENAAFSDFRHFFRHAPTFDRFDERHIRVRQLFQKIVRLIEGYTEVPVPTAAEGIKAAIRITPSRFFPDQVSKAAIPYYYAGGFPDILRYWDPEKAIKGKFDENLSFWAGTAGKYFGTPKDFVTNPLQYNLNDDPFFRIEGHLGLDVQLVYDQLVSDIAAANLPIDVVAVSAQKNPTGSLSPICNTDVYDTMYNPDRAEMIGLVDAVTLFLSKFEAGCYARLYDTRISFIPPRHSYTAENQFTGQLYPNDPTQAINELKTALAALKTAVTPNTLAGFNRVAFLTAFNTSLSKAITLKLKVLKLVHDLAYDRVYRYSSPAYFSITFMLSELLTYLNRFITDFTYRRIAYLGAHYTDLKANVIANSSLAKFASKNPGLEHLAGVTKGGTFVLVYDDSAKGGAYGRVAGNVVADFMLPGSCCLACDMPDGLKPNTTPLVIPKVINVHAGDSVDLELWPDPVDPNEYSISTDGVSCTFSNAIMTVPTSESERLRVRIDVDPNTTFIGGQRGSVMFNAKGSAVEVPIHINIQPACLPFLFAKDLYVTTIKGSIVDVFVLGMELFGDGVSLSLPNPSTAASATIFTMPGSGNERYIRYTPNGNFVGLDQFTYQLRRGTNIAMGTVTVLVAPCCGDNPPPIGDIKPEFMLGGEIDAFMRTGLNWVSPVDLQIKSVVMKPVDGATGKSTKMIGAREAMIYINDNMIGGATLHTGESVFLNLPATAILTTKDVLRVTLSSPMSFYNVGLDPEFAYDKMIVVNENLVVLSSYAGPYASQDGGYSWQPFTNGLPLAGDYTDIVWSGDLAFVTGTGSQLYRLDKNAAGDMVWTLKNTGILTGGTLQAVVAFNGGYYVAQSGVTSTAGVTAPGVYFSTDGETWAGFSTGLADNQVLSLATDGACLYAGTEDGLFKWDPKKGDNWSRVSGALDGVRISCIEIENSNTIYVSGLSDGVWLTQDAGATWTMIHNGLDMAAGNLVYSVVFTDKALIASTKKGLYTSRDLMSWSRVEAPEVIEARQTMVLDNRWVVTTAKGVYQSTDNGHTFNQGQDLQLSFLTEKIVVTAPPVDAGTETGGGGSATGGGTGTGTGEGPTIPGK